MRAVASAARFPTSPPAAASHRWWRAAAGKALPRAGPGAARLGDLSPPGSSSRSEGKIQEQKEKWSPVSWRNGTVTAGAFLAQSFVLLGGTALPLRSPGISARGKEGRLSFRCVSPCSRRRDAVFNSWFLDAKSSARD